MLRHTCPDAVVHHPESCLTILVFLAEKNCRLLARFFGVLLAVVRAVEDFMRSQFDPFGIVRPVYGDYRSRGYAHYACVL